MKTLYFHINNGGVSIGVDRCSLVIESSHFGNNIHVMRLDTTVEGIRMLGQLLLEHADSDPKSRHGDEHAAQPKIVDRRMLTNIATCDDYDYSMSGAARADSPLNMSQTKTHPSIGGVVVYDATTEEYWLGDLIMGFQKTDTTAVPDGARWTGMKNPEVVTKIKEARKELELTNKQAAENSAFGIAVHTNDKGRPAYWVANSGKFIFHSSGTGWFVGRDRPEDCPELGWRPVENSEVAAIIHQKSKEL